jgi:hypothetical protein
MRTNPSRGLSDYRAALHGSEDVVVGAYARAQRRRRLGIALLGAGLIAVAASLYVLLRPHGEISGGRGARILVRCVAPGCGFEGAVAYHPGTDLFPLTCPKCEAKSCQKLWQCRDCRLLFLPKGGLTDVHCPRCHGRKVGAAELPADSAP